MPKLLRNIAAILAHALGTLTGAAVAYLAAVGSKAAVAYGIGVLFLCGGIAASLMIPAPVWFIALDVLAAYLPMAWLGVLLARRISGKPAAKRLAIALVFAPGRHRKDRMSGNLDSIFKSADRRRRLRRSSLAAPACEVLMIAR